MTTTDTTAVAPTGGQPPAGGLPAKRARRIYQDIDELDVAFRDAADRANLLAPVIRIDYIPPLRGVSLRALRFDPSVKAGDVYKVGWKDDELALTKSALDRICGAAGINWDSRLSGRLDDGSDPHYCRYLAVGWMTDFDGTRRDFFDEKEVDLRDGSGTLAKWAKEAREKFDRDVDYRAKNKKPAPTWTWQEKYDERVAQAREHILGVCISKARNRAIRHALGIKAKYTPAELSRPFAIPKLVPMGDNIPESWPEDIRREVAMMVARHAMGIADAFSGPTAAPLAPPPQPAAIMTTATPVQLTRGTPPPPVSATAPSDEDEEGATDDTQEGATDTQDQGRFDDDW